MRKGTTATPDWRAPSGIYVMVEWSGAGGIAQYSFLLADALARRGVRVRYASRARHELAGLPHVHRQLPLWPAPPPPWLSGRPRKALVAAGWMYGWARLISFAARRRGLVVHVQCPESLPEAAFLVLLRLTRAIVIVTAHNAVPPDQPGIGGLIQRLAYRTAHGLIAQTQTDAMTVRGLAGGRRPTRTIPHGSYAPIADGFQAPRRNRDDVVTVAHIGSFRGYKGFDTVVEAFRIAFAQDPRLRLRAAGHAPQPDEVLRILGALPAGSWSVDMRFLDISDLVAEARDADIVLLGHRRVSESGVLHLALAAGTPVVGPALGNVEGLLEEKPAWLYPAGDAASAARALLALATELRRDPRPVRASAREIVEKRAPSWDRVAKEHLQLIESLETNRSKASRSAS